ncbi:hypothetical protein ACHAWF_017068 [Thalassiosira exigua]
MSSSNSEVSSSDEDGISVSSSLKIDGDEIGPSSDDQSHFPAWSWDRVRTWLAIRRTDKYSGKQIRALAAQDMVMLEKTNGVLAY